MNDEKTVKTDTTRREPEFVRDVLTYFTPSVLLLGFVASYIYTGNILIGVWFIYVGAPLYNILILDDDRNFEKKNEKAFIWSKMFLAPLMFYELLMIIVWIGGMALFSTAWKPDNWLFNMIVVP